jgi:hypothetical protein
MTEKKPGLETWIGGVALATAILAVFAAVTTLYMGKFSSRAVMLQGQESNQWAYYQAKSIKSHAYEIQKERVELELFANGKGYAGLVAERYGKLADSYRQTIARYDKEKEEIKAKAEKLAKEKETAQLRAGHFGYGLIFLQIAIMLSSISALTRKKGLWYVGLACSTGWLFFFLDAIYLFY